MCLKHLCTVFHKLSNGIHHFPLKGSLIFIFFGAEALEAKNENAPKIMVPVGKSGELFFGDP